MFLQILRFASGDRPAGAHPAGTWRSVARAILAGFLTAGSAVPLIAGSTSAPMTVSVQVIARAVLAVESGPGTIAVTDSDVARGYVDIGQPIVLRTRTNSRVGYLLQTTRSDGADGVFRAVELTLPDAAIELASGESWLRRPYVAGGELLTIRGRLWLAPGTVAGTYALPFVFSALPL